VVVVVVVMVVAVVVVAIIAVHCSGLGNPNHFLHLGVICRLTRIAASLVPNETDYANSLIHGSADSAYKRVQ